MYDGKKLRSLVYFFNDLKSYLVINLGCHKGDDENFER